MAGLIQKIEVEVEVKCNAQKYWECVKDPLSFTKNSSDRHESTEILEGDGKSPGSFFQVNYKPGQPIPFIKMKIEYVDEEKKTMSYSAIGEDPMNIKSKKVTVVVTPKGEGAFTKWTCEFTKANDQVPNPEDSLRERAIKVARSIEDYILRV